MRIFNLKQHVTIEPELRLRAREFAQKVVDTVDYRDSNQRIREKIRLDHFISKIGEEAVRKVFEMYGCEVKGPDYRIYDGNAKSWEDDLFIDDVGLAVKTQSRSSAEKYGLSWTFQDSESRKDNIFNRPKAWVCFVECNDVGKSYNSIVYPSFQVGELIFKPPKLAHLQGKKRVVYAEDLPWKEKSEK